MSLSLRASGLQPRFLLANRGWKPLPRLLAVLLTGLWATVAFAAGDIVADICRHAPPAGQSYAAVVNELHRLEKNPRVTLDCAGKSRQARNIPVAIVHDPAVPLENLVRVFLVARQHGTEETGTTACLALLRYFASSNDPVARDLMRQMALIMVPVANPDGMSASQRRNGAGVDLNRDWNTFSQPETRAVAAAVKKYQPHALIDMHELPAGSSKPAFRDNFVQTIGRHSKLPTQVANDCSTTSARLASWMGQRSIPVNVYYDTPSESLNLCHRYFGLACGLPAYLFEAKCGSRRGHLTRTQFHVLGTLVVANYALHQYYMPDGDEPQMAGLPEPECATPAGGGLAFTLAQPLQQQVARGQLPLVAKLNQAPPGSYVLFHVDGIMKALTNTAPHEYLLDTLCYEDGEHSIEVQVCDAEGKLLGQTSRTFVIDNKLAAAE